MRSFILTVFYELRPLPTARIQQLLDKSLDNLSADELCAVLGHLRYEYEESQSPNRITIDRIEKLIGFTYEELMNIC